MTLSDRNLSRQRNLLSKTNHQIIFIPTVVKWLRDILVVSSSTSKIPRVNGGFRHVLLAIDTFSSYLTYVPVKNPAKPQFFIAALLTKFLDSGHPFQTNQVGRTI